MNDYDRLPDNTKEKLESDFRNLLLCIPAWRRKELENIVREECVNILSDKIKQFGEHWTVSNVSVDSQISTWKDYVDPVTGNINESERF
jgi:hypothetical protein